MCRAAVTATALFTASAALAQPPASPLNAYAYADCSATNAPQVRIVSYDRSRFRRRCRASAPTPAVRSHLQRRRPTSSSIDADHDCRRCDRKADRTRAAIVVSGRRRLCAATSGTVTMQRGADGSLTGQILGVNGDRPARMNRFTAVWTGIDEEVRVGHAVKPDVHRYDFLDLHARRVPPSPRR